jgi:hypothetical protein
LAASVDHTDARSVAGFGPNRCAFDAVEIARGGRVECALEFQRPRVQGGSLGDAARVVVHFGNVVAADEHLRVVRAEFRLPPGEGALELRPRPSSSIRRTTSEGDDWKRS